MYGQPAASAARFTPDAFLAAVGAALAEDGCDPRWQQGLGVPALVGRRADFRLRWFATRLHLFTMVAVIPSVGRQDIENFTEWAQDYAKRNKGGLPGGFQTGVAVLPCLVSERVDPAALGWAAEKQRARWACMTRPVVVDAAAGVVAAYRGKPALGRIYAAHLNGRIAAYFDRAAAVAGGR